MAKLLIKNRSGKEILRVLVKTPAPKQILYGSSLYKRSYFKKDGDAVYKPTMIHQVIITKE